ncbi:alpha/beta fold hydrolase [Sporichthya brevicatena]|uniref:Alpha/beta fold hydrolase n=1 Tax=Sporichthya brevicatena TaxID=171442 RepID=A0ABN1G891_9ACTN
MRPLLSGLVAGVLTAGLLSAPGGTSAASAASTQNPFDIVEVPISFAVKNTNRTTVPCASDGKDYTIRGVVIGPRETVAGGRAATLYLHAVTWTSEYFHLDIPGHNYARSLAALGHVSIAVDRLGYGKSDHPAGLGTCFGSEADVAGQMVDALRAGDYQVAGRTAAPFEKVFLGGSSVGGMIANIAAYSFHNVDGVINQGFGDFAASSYAAEEVFKASTSCFEGGDSGALKDYVHFAKDSLETFYFNTASPEVRRHVPAPAPDPCGQIESVMAGIGNDVLRLGEIDVPVLLVFGTADAVFPPPAIIQQDLRSFGSAEVTRAGIPGASHFPILEQHVDLMLGATDQWLENRLK